MSPTLLQIEELQGGERKGIGSILDFSAMKTEKRESLRRTFSADMSCKKWVAQNLLFSPKKIDSNEDFSTMSSSDTSLPSSSSTTSEREEQEPSKKLESPQSFDIWGSIQWQKTANLNSLFTPYIHPLVKQSSALSENSLKICTESLGSETGSNGHPDDLDYFRLDRGDDHEGDHDHEEEDEEVDQDEMQHMSQKNDQIVVNYNCCVSRKSHTRLFPPPLSSISRRDGPCLQLRPHRKDGRLVIEAVPVAVPSHSYLHAHRQGGRLRLSFIYSSSTKEAHIPSQQEQSKMKHKEVQIEEATAEEEEAVIVVEMKRVEEEDQVMRMGHPVLVMMKKFICPNPWMGEQEGKDEQNREVSSILCTGNFNGCDGCWKKGCMAHPSEECLPNKLMVSKIKKPLVIKEEDLLPHVMRCKESPPLRPLIFWEPTICIATI